VQTDEELLAELDRIAEHHRLSWLPFSTGGSEIWEEQRSAAQLFQLLGGEHVIEIRRFRDRSGAVFIQLSYEEQEETVTCELFQTKVKLPSCPESVSRDEQAWTFKGVGQGHGQGLSIVRAAELQRRAQSSIEILRDAFSSESFRAEK